MLFRSIIKVSLGAEKTVSWEYIKNLDDLIEELNHNNVDVVAVEQSKKSIDYKDFKIKKTTAFIFGNEVDGISQEVLKKINKIIEIPMLGNKESLNISVSVGVVLFKVLNI